MSSNPILEQIKAQIHKDAEQEIHSIETESKAQKEALKEKAHEKTERTRAEYRKMTQEKVARLQDQTRRAAGSELKNKLLSAKREVLMDIYANALPHLVESKHYEKWLENLFKQAMKATQEGYVIAPKGKEQVTQKALQAAGASYALEGTSEEFTGGFKLVSDRLEIDASFETILQKELWEEFEIQLNGLLFN